MKKKIGILLAVLTISLSLGACTQGNGEKVDENKPTTQTEDASKSKKIELSKDIDLEGYNLVSEFFYNFDEEGSVALYTNAELDENNQPALDDGQNWLLIARTKDGYYKLFDDFIQLGVLDYNGFTVDEDFYVTVKTTGTANINFDEFKYDKKNKVFVETEKYSKDNNVNVIF